MKTGELLDRAGIADTYRERNAFRKYLTVDWARYFADRKPGSGNHVDDWSDRDVVVIRLILDCIRDGVGDPGQGRFSSTSYGAANEGTDLIEVRCGLVHSYYRPRWETT